MYKLSELYELKNELVKKTEKILSDVKNSGGTATPEQEAKFDCMESELKILNKKIEEERLSLPTSKPILMTPQNNIPPFNVKPRMNKLNSKSFRGMFYGNENTQLSNNGFADMNEFLNILHLGRADRRLLQNSMVEGIPEYGGYAVPEEFGAFLMDKSLENEIIRPRASVWAMGSETKKVPAFDGSDHTNNLFGGISGEWLEEGKSGTRKTAKLRLIQLKAKKLACFSQASNELIADGMSFEEMLAGAIIKGLGWYMDYAFINGTGEGEPLGILNDPALITITKEQNQSPGTITYNNIVGMFSRLNPPCFKNAIWIANPSVIPQLLTMTINIGTGGNQVPVFKEESGKFSLFGKEVIFTEKCPELGLKGDLILADLSQYAIGLRKEIAIDRSNVPGWMEDMTDYRIITRLDGKGIWDKAIKPKNANTLSWAVVLEKR